MKHWEKRQNSKNMLSEETGTKVIYQAGTSRRRTKISELISGDSKRRERIKFHRVRDKFNKFNKLVKKPTDTVVKYDLGADKPIEQTEPIRESYKPWLREVFPSNT